MKLPIEWENLCNGCGYCCTIERSPSGNCVACPGLDTVSNRCTVYDVRHVTHPCIKITPANTQHLFESGVLPHDCPYVRVVQGKIPLPYLPERVSLIPYTVASEGVTDKYEAYCKKWFAARLKEKPNEDGNSGK